MAAARHFSKCSLTIWGRPLGMADSVAATAANQSTPTAVYANIVQTVQPRCIGGVPAGLGSHYAGLPSTYVLGYHMPPLRGCRLAIRSVSSSPGKTTQTGSPNDSPEGAAYDSPARKCWVSQHSGNRVPQGRHQCNGVGPFERYLRTPQLG